MGWPRARCISRICNASVLPDIPDALAGRIANAYVAQAERERHKVQEDCRAGPCRHRSVLKQSSSWIRRSPAGLEVTDHGRHRRLFGELHSRGQRHPLTTGPGHEPRPQGLGCCLSWCPVERTATRCRIVLSVHGPDLAFRRAATSARSRGSCREHHAQLRQRVALLGRLARCPPQCRWRAALGTAASSARSPRTASAARCANWIGNTTLVVSWVGRAPESWSCISICMIHYDQGVIATIIITYRD